MVKQDEVTIKFKINADLRNTEKEQILLQLMNEIQDRMMYVTEIKYNDKLYFEFDDKTYKHKVHKIDEVL